MFNCTLSIYVWNIVFCFVEHATSGEQNDWHLCNSRWGQRRHLRICVLLMDLMWLRLCTAEFGRSRRKNPIWCLPEVIFNSKQLSWVSRIYTTAEALLLTGELSFCGWPTMGSFFSKNNQNCAARIHLLPPSEWRYYTVAFLVPIRQHLCSRREPCPFEIILETAGRVMHP